MNHYTTKIQSQINKMSVQHIFVDPHSEMGQFMASMNKSEETRVINSFKSQLESNKMTKQQVITELVGFMSMWGSPSTRTWYYIPDYIKELTTKETTIPSK